MLTKAHTLNSARAFGSVSVRNSKMPGSAFAISPSACKVGMKLASVKGSVCSKCYAMKLEKMRPSVRMGWAANLDKSVAAIANNPMEWAEAIAHQINHYALKTGVYYHRWFDAGDLQSVEMLAAIIMVVKLTSGVNHWLPTREAMIVRDYLQAYGAFPDNLVVRVSSTMVGDKPVSRAANTSTVHKKGTPAHGHTCPASTQGNACGDCRACWNKAVDNVSYPLH